MFPPLEKLADADVETDGPKMRFELLLLWLLLLLCCAGLLAAVGFEIEYDGGRIVACVWNESYAPPIVCEADDEAVSMLPCCCERSLCGPPDM